MYPKIKLKWKKLYLMLLVVLPIKVSAVLPDDLNDLNNNLCSNILGGGTSYESSQTFCENLGFFMGNTNNLNNAYTYIKVMANENYSSLSPSKNNTGNRPMDSDLLAAIQNINQQALASCTTAPVAPYLCPPSTPAGS